MNRKSAFTLIELLVVVAIIAILASLLLPMLPAFFGRGKAVEDLNNLRGIASLINQYTNDTKGTFLEKRPHDGIPWPKRIYRYGKDWRIFRSPFDHVSTERPRSSDTDPIPVSYGLSELLFDTTIQEWESSESVLILVAPAIQFSGDGREIKFQNNAFNTANIMISAPGGTGVPVRNGYGTHENRQKITVAFVDGHAGEMEWHKFADNTTERGKAQWDPKFR